MLLDDLKIAIQQFYWRDALGEGLQTFNQEYR